MYVFISHSRINSSYAFRLSQELANRNIETWLDVRDLAPGADWNQGVASAIQNAAAVVFVIGPNSGDRGQNFEWHQVVSHEYYLDLSKPLVPVIVGNPEIPGFLKLRRPLSLGDTPRSCEEAADGIVNALRDPASCVDPKKLELGRKARREALDHLREYAQTLAEEAVRSAGLRAQGRGDNRLNVE